MAQSTISTELLRAIKTSPPTRPADYRDPKVPGFVLRARPTGVHTWRVQLPDRSWISLGRTDEVSLADAREAAQQCRARVKLGQVVAETAVADTPSLAEFLRDHYAPWMAATRGPRSGQVGRIRSAFADLLDLSLADLTTARLERWRAERRYRRRTPGNVPRRIALPTVNRDLAALQSALQRAVEWGQLRTNPLRAVKRGTEDGSASIRSLSKEEEQRLRAALAQREATRRAARDSADEWRRARDYAERGSHGAYTNHLSPLVLLALNTGLRRGELFQLRWQDVSLPGRRVTVHGAGAKTRQTRHVPLNSEAICVLERWQPAEAGARDHVFPGAAPNEPLTDVKKAWAGLMKRAQLTAFRFHDLRHTFASKLVMAGVDLNTVRELLGHSDIAMTLRYAHLAPEHKANAVERLVLI